MPFPAHPSSLTSPDPAPKCFKDLLLLFFVVFVVVINIITLLVLAHAHTQNLLFYSLALLKILVKV